MRHKTAHEITELFKKGQISAKEIASSTLETIKKEDGETLAYLNVFSDRIMEKAKELDDKKSAGKPLGKLAGVPVAIKDNIHVKGELTTCASKFLTNYRAVFDATVIRLLEEEGALIVGKTNLDEFAMGSSTENSAFQVTKNPWNKKHSPGGSSGGSAVSVAAGYTPLALGSDTGGSVRQPAAFCGIVGFKPTYGRVSRYGLVAFASSLDQIGPFSKTVSDAALIMEVIGKHCTHDSTSFDLPSENYTQKLGGSIKGARIGYSSEILKDLQNETRDNFLAALEVFKSQGATLVEVDLSLLKQSIAVYYILATAEASTNLARFDGIRYGKRSERAKTLDEIYDFSKQEGFGPEVKNRILLGTYVLSSGYSDAYYKRAQKVRTLIIHQFQKAFESCDIIASPTSPIPAFPIGGIQEPLQMYLQDIFTIPANLAGLPSINLPSGFNKDRLPFGLLLTGRALQDAKLLQLAYLFEKETKYYKETP